MVREKAFLACLLLVSGQASLLTLTGEVAARPPVRRDQFGDALPEGALVRMGTIRLRHGDVISSLAFSPDGKLLASGGGTLADTDIHLWDPGTGKLLRLLVGHTRSITSLAFSPDGRLLASVDDDRSLLVWEVSAGRSLYSDREHVWSMAFTPDGKVLTVGCSDGIIRMLDARTGKKLRRWRDGERIVTSVAFSPDAKLLASGDSYHTVRLWDMALGKLIHRWTVDRAGEYVAFSPDGKMLVTWGLSSTVHLYSVPSGRPISRLSPEDGELIRGAAFSPDGRFFVTIDDLTAHLWNLVTHKEIPLVWEPGRSLRSVAFTPNGKRLALAGEEHCIRFWDVTTGRESTPSSGGHLLPVCALAIPQAASWVASADGDDGGKVRIWNLNTGKQLRVLPADSNVGALALSPLGDVLVSGGRHTLCYWDPINGKRQGQHVFHTERLAGRTSYLAFSPEGKHLLVHAYSGGACYLDVCEDTPICELRENFDYVALSPNGKMMAGVLKDRVQLWDLASGKMRYARTKNGGYFLCVAFSPDGRLLATDELLWNVDEGKLLRRFLDPENKDYPYAAAFSPDGKSLVTGTSSGVVRLWEVETGKERRCFSGHRGIVHAVAFCRSGQAVVSASEDTSLLVWDVTGQLLRDAKHRTPLTTEQLNHLWTNMGDADARKAYDALCSLAASPSGVPAFVLCRIRSSFQFDRAKAEKWIAQLDDDQFTVRENATRRLEQLGDRAERFLRLALTRSSSLEQRRRVQKLLDHLSTSEHPPERILALRAVELLEHIGTTEAREGLRAIADKSPGSIIRRNAVAALERLARKPRRSQK